MSNLLSGRTGRGKYVAITVLISLVSYAFLFAIGFVSAVSESEAHNAGVFGLIVGIVACVFQLILAVRRLHDIGKPGSHAWLLLVPFYGIYLSLVLCFAKGASSSGEYESVSA